MGRSNAIDSGRLVKHARYSSALAYTVGLMMLEAP